MTLTVRWIDGKREPVCPPNPLYPNGIDIDLSRGASVTCSAALPYPALRIGGFAIDCPVCGQSAYITTAGRADDPRSIKVACKANA
jgi:hypothetical protein